MLTVSTTSQSAIAGLREPCRAGGKLDADAVHHRLQFLACHVNAFALLQVASATISFSVEWSEIVCRSLAVAAVDRSVEHAASSQARETVRP
jgi:hypothetical protein